MRFCLFLIPLEDYYFAFSSPLRHVYQTLQQEDQIKYTKWVANWKVITIAHRH